MTLKEELKTQPDALKSQGQPYHRNHSWWTSLARALPGCAMPAGDARDPGLGAAWSPAPPQGSAEARGGARGLRGRGCGDRARSQGPGAAGTLPIVQPAPTSKFRLSLLSRRRPLSKRGFERLGSLGSALENSFCFSGRRGGPQGLPLRLSPAFIERIKGRSLSGGCSCAPLPSLYLPRKRRTPAVPTGRWGMNGLFEVSALKVFLWDIYNFLSLTLCLRTQ